MVLLKNDGALPLKTSGIKIAVVGPLADQTKVLLGNYNGTPTHTVSILEGIRKRVCGCHHRLRCRHAVPRPGGCAGSRIGSYHRWQAGRQGQLSKLDMTNVRSGLPSRRRRSPRASTRTIDIRRRSRCPPKLPMCSRWRCVGRLRLTARRAGDYNLGVEAAGGFRVQLDGKKSLQGYAMTAKRAARPRAS